MAARRQTDPLKERYTPGCVCNVGSTETGSLSLERKFVVMSQDTVFSRSGEAGDWDIMSRQKLDTGSIKARLCREQSSVFLEETDQRGGARPTVEPENYWVVRRV